MGTNAFITLGKFAYDNVDNTNAISAAAVSQLKNYLLAGAGVGATAAGLRGLYNMASRAVKPPTPKYPSAIMTPVPIPVEDDDRNKQASAISLASQMLGANPEARINAVTSLPGYLPAAFLAGGAGMYGGWKGVDSLLEAQRHSSQQSDLDAAKTDFESALLGSYGKPKRNENGIPKAAAEKLGEALDQLYEKTALFDDATGHAKGLYGAYALMTGLPAAYWAYNRGNQSSDRAALQKAMQLRTRQSFLRRPSELYAVPQPVPVHANKPKEIPDESMDDSSVEDMPAQRGF